MEATLTQQGSVTMNTAARFRALTEQLRGEIAAGKYDGTGQLPSLTALAKREGLSLSSVQRALDPLKADGTVYTVPGRGVFIAR